MQGKAWLEENLPNAEVIEVSSTAEGAKIVARQQDPGCAAIASAACADVYGLKVIAAGIQNNESNKTRFYVLSMAAPATAPADRLAFIAMGEAAQLPSLMAQMQQQGMTLITIHDDGSTEIFQIPLTSVEQEHSLISKDLFMAAK